MCFNLWIKYYKKKKKNIIQLNNYKKNYKYIYKFNINKKLLYNIILVKKNINKQNFKKK